MKSEEQINNKLNCIKDQIKLLENLLSKESPSSADIRLEFQRKYSELFILQWVLRDEEQKDS